MRTNRVEPRALRRGIKRIAATRVITWDYLSLPTLYAKSGNQRKQAMRAKAGKNRLHGLKPRPNTATVEMGKRVSL